MDMYRLTELLGLMSLFSLSRKCMVLGLIIPLTNMNSFTHFAIVLALTYITNYLWASIMADLILDGGDVKVLKGLKE